MSPPDFNQLIDAMKLFILNVAILSMCSFLPSGLDEAATASRKFGDLSIYIDDEVVGISFVPFQPRCLWVHDLIKEGSFQLNAPLVHYFHVAKDLQAQKSISHLKFHLILVAIALLDQSVC